MLNAIRGDDKTEVLTGIYDEYLEKDVGDYFAQPPYLPEGFKVRWLYTLMLVTTFCNPALLQLKGKNRKEWYLDILRPPYCERKTELLKTYRVLSLTTLR